MKKARHTEQPHHPRPCLKRIADTECSDCSVPLQCVATTSAMVVAKTSRKGKKAWRRNIDTTQVGDSRTSRTHRFATPGAAPGMPSDDGSR